MSSTVKIPRQAFIDRLKKTLDQNELNMAENEKKRVAHDKLVAKANEELVKYIAKNPKYIKHIYFGYNGNATIEVLPIPTTSQLPELKLARELSHYDINEINQTIAVVELSECEFVPASITKNASRFLI